MSMSSALATYIAQVSAQGVAIRNQVSLALITLKNHLLDTKNPHRTDKADVGLDKVQNMAPATKAQAEVGKNNNVVMSPKRVDQYMDAKIYTPLTQLFDDVLND